MLCYTKVSSFITDKNSSCANVSSILFNTRTCQYFSTWRVGAIQQTKRLARDNHDNLATGQPRHLSHSLHSGKTFTYHLLSSREDG